MREKLVYGPFLTEKKSYHISAYRNQELTHIITVPDNLKEKYFYSKKGSYFANSIYALDLYREYLGKKIV